MVKSEKEKARNLQQNSTKNGFLSLPQNTGRDKEGSYSHSIVFVWSQSQYDGANIVGVSES